ncbi:MAG: bifunctional demethylmenaquinone methyltransferase/2-methoxy-6-polyprenyl-1,4-benzoquinol methylase UbiE [Planctomycetaceae bacterium]|jgi:demethylmenaquinone methyltransferase/2-methoxy-6-polyprenyl-1,4-benzoquinol methylase|nr:bifunctional demethylmenaquinone methyltransferase/2-methoxy-6-polyprenyl-1,4-benzoquinol methylase UbiE [Planctomycetaceae bacterium]
MNSLPVDKSPERIRRMFGKVAPRYDMMNRLLSLGIDRWWRRVAARQLLHDQTPCGDVLDVCCGTGDLSLALEKWQQQLKTQRTIFGIDFSLEMIDIALRKAKGNVHFQFSVGDATELPFDDDRFAVVTVAFGLRNVSDTACGLAEMVRVCRPGGTVAVLEFSMPTLPILRHCYRFYFCTLLPKLGEWFVKNQDQAYLYLSESVRQFDRPEQLANRLRELGIRDVQTQSMTFGIATLVWGIKMDS